MHESGPSCPNCPTISEAGLAGFDANNWYGLVVPAKGLDPAPGTPEQFGAYIKSERTKWARVIKESGARAE
jgi:tripartite-type tricarboxylate transporter receptor subunit TctC